MTIYTGTLKFGQRHQLNDNTSSELRPEPRESLAPPAAIGAAQVKSHKQDPNIDEYDV